MQELVLPANGKSGSDDDSVSKVEPVSTYFVGVGVGAGVGVGGIC